MWIENNYLYGKKSCQIVIFHNVLLEEEEYSSVRKSYKRGQLRSILRCYFNSWYIRSARGHIHTHEMLILSYCIIFYFLVVSLLLRGRLPPRHICIYCRLWRWWPRSPIQTDRPEIGQNGLPNYARWSECLALINYVANGRSDEVIDWQSGLTVRPLPPKRRSLWTVGSFILNLILLLPSREPIQINQNCIEQ
jgi:hypothetical protein